MQFEHIVCGFCGCVCDDIKVTVEDGRVTGVKQACALGRAWLMGHSTESCNSVALVDGEPAPLDEALDVAARYLASSRNPLIYGLSSTVCEAQRQAVELADLLGSNLDTCASVCHGPSGMGFQYAGDSTCTLGEVKNRADLVIYWGANSAEAHPRHFARYAVMPKGLYRPGGRKERTAVVIDIRPTATSRLADLFLQIRPGRDFEAIWALRSLVRGIPLDESSVAITGLTLAQLQDLAQRMMACKFGVLFVGLGLTQTRGRQLNTAAAMLLIRDLNAHTKFALQPLRGHGNVTGHDQVIAWQTGYPFAVNFGRGYPRYNPGEFTAVDLLARREVDAAVIVAADPVCNFPRASSRYLSEIPTICLDNHDTDTTKAARVVIHTGTSGINVEGTFYRMDNVPVRMHKFLPSPYPSDEEVLSEITERVRQLLAARKEANSHAANH
jgi:formylmethanofuran dehydrogenase subunit B